MSNFSRFKSILSQPIQEPDIIIIIIIIIIVIIILTIFVY